MKIIAKVKCRVGKNIKLDVNLIFYVQNKKIVICGQKNWIMKNKWKSIITLTKLIKKYYVYIMPLYKNENS